MPVELANPLLESGRMNYLFRMPSLAIACTLILGCSAEHEMIDPQAVALGVRSTMDFPAGSPESEVRNIELGDTVMILPNAVSRNMSARMYSRSARDEPRMHISDGKVLRQVGANRVLATAVGSAQVTIAGTAGRSVAAFRVTERGGLSNAQPSSSVMSTLQVRTAPGAGLRGELSSGVPLAAGKLRDSDVPNVSVFVGDAEVASFVEALKGKHPDGSLRSILVQFAVPDAAGEVTLRRNVGTPRRRARVPVSPIPDRFLMYADMHDLAATQVVGPVSLSADESYQGGRALDAKYSEFEPIQWAQSGDEWTSNFYDRALAYFSYSIRQGSSSYYNRGARLAVSYRRQYLEANNYGTSEWWAQLDGLAAHYWLTGDDSSRTAVIRAAESLNLSRGGTARLTNTTSHEWMDGRVAARVLSSKFLAIALDAEPYGTVGDWRGAASQDVRDILSIQAPDGAWRYFSNCGESSNFMSGLIAGALVQYADVTGDEARVREPIRRFANWLWTTQWKPAEEVFNYYSGNCVKDGKTIGDTFAAPDLNGFYVEMYGWLWRQTKDPVHIQRGDAVLTGLISHSWFAGSKQFNQAFRTSTRYLALRGR